MKNKYKTFGLIGLYGLFSIFSINSIVLIELQKTMSIENAMINSGISVLWISITIIMITLMLAKWLFKYWDSTKA